ncbi:hypothetical protein [Brevibacillus massiliensis]|uniref:hypothetical protein n=1 Tax=Brevibacillus massiliensis TaxID=1118054 RepID=UPI0003137404|nr:hypothetical protein [Brevibacillus massiliensis]
MSNYLSLLLCLIVLVIILTIGFVSYKYSEEQSVVRSVYEQLSHEMAAAGYLDPAVAAYYQEFLRKKGFEQDTPFFYASHTNPANRAERPRYGEVLSQKNFVELSVQVKPSFSTQLVSFFRTGEATLTFRNMRVSQYIPEE